MTAASILGSTKDKCFICGRRETECHHIYRGSHRKVSDREGFVVYLCSTCHRLGPMAIHNNGEMNTALMEACQRRYEKEHSREEFMALIGRSYL